MAGASMASRLSAVVDSNLQKMIPYDTFIILSIWYNSIVQSCSIVAGHLMLALGTHANTSSPKGRDRSSAVASFYVGENIKAKSFRIFGTY